MHTLKNELNICSTTFAAYFPKILGENSLFEKYLYIPNHNVRLKFPLTYSIFEMFSMIPTNTLSCEKSFSCL